MSNTNSSSSNTTTSSRNSNRSNVIKSGISGAIYLILLQIVSRIFTFILNTWLVTAVDTNILGVYSIQYQLLSSTILFLSRESIRRTCIRIQLLKNTNTTNHHNSSSGTKTKKDGDKEEEIKVELSTMINLTWMIIPVGFIVTYGMEWFFNVNPSVSIQGNKSIVQSDYDYGIRLFSISAIIELLSEPAYILSQNQLLFKVRTIVEGCSLFIRTFSTYYFVVYLNSGLAGFGYAQLLYSLLLFFGYFGYFLIQVIKNKNKKKADNDDDDGQLITSFWQLFPNFSKRTYDKNLINLALLYQWQSYQKLILTEGEKFVLYFSDNLTNQAIFSVVSNLGSLIARFLFQPIEETCFSLFPKLFSESNNNDKDEEEEKQKSKTEVAMVFICFGPNYSQLLLNQLYRNKFHDTNAGSVLGLYCLYVGFIAINGVSEAFVHSISKEKELKNLNWLLIIIGLCYLALTAILSRYFETFGIIIANCISM
eukprot:gene6716-8325_t